MWAGSPVATLASACLHTTQPIDRFQQNIIDQLLHKFTRKEIIDQHMISPKKMSKHMLMARMELGLRAARR